MFNVPYKKNSKFYNSIVWLRSNYYSTPFGTIFPKILLNLLEKIETNHMKTVYKIKL